MDACRYVAAGACLQTMGGAMMVVMGQCSLHAPLEAIAETVSRARCRAVPSASSQIRSSRKTICRRRHHRHLKHAGSRWGKVRVAQAPRRQHAWRDGATRETQSATAQDATVPLARFAPCLQPRPRHRRPRRQHPAHHFNSSARCSTAART